MKIGISLIEMHYDDASFELFYDKNKKMPDIRRLKELEDVIYDKTFFNNSNKDIPLYYMYRNIVRDQDKQIFEMNSVRFDITILPPKTLGEEYVKTVGHYHPIEEDDLTYPEVYQVLNGDAHYLLQKSDNEAISDATLITAKNGDVVIIPPNYGHITINPSSKTLIMVNIVSTRFSSIYEPIKRKHGGAYFELTGNRLIKNENYRTVPSLKIIRARKNEQTQFNKDIYTIFLEDPDRFSFLNNPKNTPISFKMPL